MRTLSLCFLLCLSLCQAKVSKLARSEDELCARAHNNTALDGIEPTMMMAATTFECQKKCVDMFPDCKAIVYFYLHKEKSHSCYFFSENSVHVKAKLVEQKADSKKDAVRMLELVENCNEFDAHPPLPEDQLASSDDKVDRKKRQTQEMVVLGNWSDWTECNDEHHQIRYQTVNFGRLLQRRPCPKRVTRQATVSYPCHNNCTNYDNCYKNFNYNSCGGCVQQPCAPSPCSSYVPVPQQPQPQPLPQQQPYVFVPYKFVEHQYPPAVVNYEPYTPVADNQVVEPVVVEIPTTPVTTITTTTTTTTTTTPAPEWASWTEWNSCSVTCGFGTQTRTRTCEQGEGRCGYELKKEVKNCDAGLCPVWTSWIEWSECSKTCGGGTMQRSRSCMYGDSCFGPAVETNTCNEQDCSTWSEWCSWSSCSKTCGPGERTRIRSCFDTIGSNSTECFGKSVETESCYGEHCCQWSSWCGWSMCDKKCGGGQTVRTRFCAQQDGLEADPTCTCEGDSREQHVCNSEECPPLCSWTDWGDYGVCSTYMACENGVKNRTRFCVGELGCTCIGLAVDIMDCQGVVPCPTTPKPFVYQPPVPQPQQPQPQQQQHVSGHFEKITDPVELALLQQQQKPIYTLYPNNQIAPAPSNQVFNLDNNVYYQPSPCQQAQQQGQPPCQQQQPYVGQVVQYPNNEVVASVNSGVQQQAPCLQQQQQPQYPCPLLQQQQYQLQQQQQQQQQPQQ